MHSLSLEKARTILDQFSHARILVIGDMMLDEYIWGKVDRISPEAPVPIVKVLSQSSMPGGAANVMTNLHALGVTVYACAVIGDDAKGHLLLSLLNAGTIHTAGILLDSSRPTIVKTRIIAHHQQVVRVDDELLKPIPEEYIQKMAQYIERHLDTIDAIIIEDYGKGLISPLFLQHIKRYAAIRAIPITVDPKIGHYMDYTDVSTITPNRSEAYDAVGDHSRTLSIEKVGEKLLKEVWKSHNVLITLGEDGMILFERGQDSLFKIPTAARDVFDVSGAGDTVIATYTAALVSGATPRQAAILANSAAGIVVGKLGTASVTREEVLNDLKRLYAEKM